MLSLTQALVDGIATGALIALVALGLSLIFAIAKFVNVAHADTLTLGAYVTLFGQKVLGWPLSVAIAASGAICALFATFAQRLVFAPLASRGGVILLIASVGLALIIRFGLMATWGSAYEAYDTPALRAVVFGGIRVGVYQLISLVAAAVLVALLGALIHRTSLGRSMRAVADDRSLAAVAGIPVNNVLYATVGISAALAGVAGSFLGLITVVSPDMGAHLLLPAFAAVVVGGIGNLNGTVVGGLLIGIVSSVAATYWQPSYQMIAVFIVMVAVLLLRPEGLFNRTAGIR
jgi:neutral amino acid transport system permease protein